jgi:hypothetical protein
MPSCNATCETRYFSKRHLKIRGLMRAIMFVAFSLPAARLSSWDVGLLLCISMLLFWHVRRRRYAFVPGAAAGVLIAWAMLPMNVEVPQLLSMTLLGSASGGSANAIVRGYYLAGILGLVCIVVVGLVVPCLIG